MSYLEVRAAILKGNIPKVCSFCCFLSFTCFLARLIGCPLLLLLLLQLPSSTPKEIIEIYQMCVHPDPEKRKDANTVFQALARFAASLSSKEKKP
jgi:hypothetical protein